MEDVLVWAEWVENNNRHIGDNCLGDVRVSTVFLGIDHSFGAVGQPVLFETMVFGGKFDQEQERYCTYEEAEKGHNRWYEKVKKAAHA